MKNRKKTFVCVFGILLAVLLAGSSIVLYCIASSIYDSAFNYRCTTRPYETFELSDFSGLTSERHTFLSNRGQQLVGYLYRQAGEDKPKAVIVFAHGFGYGGQNGYMDVFHYLTRQGYWVFAYDATANDESEGEAVGGLPQGIIDMDYAIDYAYTLEELQGLPFVLMGYSWGAISATNVLNYHPEVEAVVSLAGCNRSLDLIEDRGRKMAGDAAALLLPFASMHEYLLFGKYASCTAMKGFENSDCRVMIVHGDRDTTVPIQYGYDTYYETYGNDQRFVFKKYKNRSHNVLDYNKELMEEITVFIDQSLDIYNTQKND